MPDHYLQAIEVLLTHEGDGYTANDNGRGPCKWGITWLTAKAWGLLTSPDQIQGLTRDQAVSAYRMNVWNPSQLFRINDLALATQIFDLCVNMGEGTAIRMLQSAIQAASGAPLDIDGILGPKTAARANAFDPASLLAVYKRAAETHYRNLAAAKPEVYGKDLQGWLNRLNGTDNPSTA